MGGGASRARGTLGSARSPPVDTSRSDPGGSTKSLTGVGATPPPAVGGPVIASRRESNKLPTGIDARIIATLRQLNLARRAKPTPKGLNFERIVLKFSLARDAFYTMHAIYDQFANPDKGGLDFDGLKEALNALGAQMEEVDMREIFYESDMVRDNSLSQNEFIISLAIAHLLGLITNFDSITQSLLVHTPEDVTPALLADSKDDLSGLASPRDTSSVSTVENASELVARVLDLMVTAYLLFDTDASGTIQVNEVLALMKKHHDTGGKRSLERKASGMSSRAIRNERIKELDFDQDGTITFQEFVLTFQRWVGADIDVDE